MFNGYFNACSECLIGFTGKKIRQCPVYRGATSLGICLANDTVDKTTRKFMQAIGYQGVLDIGYRYDARDGLYKVLDVNPRIGATFRLFVARNGMDVARALYLDLTGQPIVPGLAPEGRKWIVEDLDLVSCFRYHRDGKLTFRGWISSFRGIQEAAYFALDDPLPVLMMCVNSVRELWKRMYKKVCLRVLGRFSRSSRCRSGLVKA
jgi:predicted ATP-grasp superfamily ATP-dependent carboligase